MPVKKQPLSYKYYLFIDLDRVYVLYVKCTKILQFKWLGYYGLNGQSITARVANVLQFK
jgi:hypothetical protein